MVAWILCGVAVVVIVGLSAVIFAIHEDIEKLEWANRELRKSNARLVRRIAETKATLRKHGGQHE
jgi:cell division protein FtsB